MAIRRGVAVCAALCCIAVLTGCPVSLQIQGKWSSEISTIQNGASYKITYVFEFNNGQITLTQTLPDLSANPVVYKTVTTTGTYSVASAKPYNTIDITFTARNGVPISSPTTSLGIFDIAGSGFDKYLFLSTGGADVRPDGFLVAFVLKKQ